MKKVVMPLSIETINIGWSQDQHLFHRRLGVDRPILGLMSLFPDDDSYNDLDVEFFGGDFFDHLVENFGDDQLPDVFTFMGWKLRTASKRGVGVRVLKGTPSHDRDQNVYWETINNLLETPADFKYIDTLTIESHPKLGDILYIPDCWKPTADEVWEDVCEVLRQKGITKVDWIIMHGAFKHQLPEHLHNKVHNLHDSDRYADITRKYVLVGHVHLRSQYRNIISAGSLDRLAFGEEAPKGGLIINCKPSGDDITFIQNDYARTMLTLEVEGMQFEDVVELIEKTISKHDPTYMSIRLVASRLSEVYVNMSSIERRFAPVEFVFKDNEVKPKGSHLIYLEETKNVIKDVDLSTSNILRMLKDRIGEDYNDRIDSKVKNLFGVKNE